MTIGEDSILHRPHLPSEVPEFPLEFLAGVCSIDPKLAATFLKKTDLDNVEQTLLNLISELRSLHKHKNPTSEQMKDVSRRVLLAQAAFEAKNAEAKKEHERLVRYSDQAWNLFDKLLAPIFELDSGLLPVYNRMAEIRLELEQMNSLPKSEISSVDFLNKLRSIEDELHQIEEEWVVDGVFREEGGKGQEPRPEHKSQAVCIALLHRCFRLVHRLASFEFDVSPSAQYKFNELKVLVNQLLCLREDCLNQLFDTTLLANLQDQVHKIDNERVEGVWLDESGEICSGQETLREYLQTCYDLIHECLVMHESPQAVIESTLLQTRDRLWSLVQSGTKIISQSGYDLIVEPLAETVASIRGAAEGATSNLRSIVASALSYSSKVADKLEPIDPSLLPIKDELDELKQELKCLRNERNKIWIQSLGKSGDELKEFTKLYSKKLENVEAALRTVEKAKVHNKFVNQNGEPASGQRALESLLHECFVLCIELMDDNSMA